jgi:hypothetical protein
MAKRTNRVVWGLLALAGGVLLYGFFHRPLPNDTWYQPPPDQVRLRTKWTAVKRAEIVPVPSRMRPAAEQKLQKASAVKLTGTEAEELTGRRLSIPKGKIPHLVRAVSVNEANAGFSANYSDTSLYITQGSLGAMPVPMKRRPLVLFLETTPGQVFLDYSIAL